MNLSEYRKASEAINQAARAWIIDPPQVHATVEDLLSWCDPQQALEIAIELYAALAQSKSDVDRVLFSISMSEEPDAQP